ncbi:MAG: hypothetical protein NTV48_00650 [Candidatus Vogelbacteria bacterium]|nr:hypothetical protein [Candidatus Vogelbacteria bacterium]
MNNYILIGLSFLSLAGLVWLLGRKIKANRANNIDHTQLDDYGITHLVIDYIAFKIVHFCKETLNKLYLFSLFFTRNVLSLVRYLTFRIEKKFSAVAESAKQKKTIHKEGPVSFFLQEIKEHKENAMAEIKSAAEEEGRMEN